MMSGANGSLLPTAIFYYGHIKEKYSIKAYRKVGDADVENNFHCTSIELARWRYFAASAERNRVQIGTVELAQMIKPSGILFRNLYNLIPVHLL